MVKMMPLTPPSFFVSCFIKVVNGLPFWCWHSQVVPEEAVKLVLYDIILCRSCEVGRTLHTEAAGGNGAEVRQTADC